MKDVEDALEQAGKAPRRSAWDFPACSCRGDMQQGAELRSAQYGKRNTLHASTKGWIYLERFASMVKVAMTHKSQIGGMVFTNSELIREQIFSGGERLRA